MSMTIQHQDIILFHTKYNLDCTTTCWNWTGSAPDQSGHGRFSVRGNRWLAHRFSYETFVGKLDNSLEIHHICENPLCVNPDHLKQISHKDHMSDKITPQFTANIKRNQTHCIHGHKLSERNVIIRANGTRCCRKCNNDRKLTSYYKKKAVD